LFKPSSSPRTLPEPHPARASISPENFGPIVAIMSIVAAGLIALGCVTYKAAQRNRDRREHEQTRRELAAYVAEGSMTAEDADRILRAQPDRAS
jgi:uncharacterized protein HemX